MSNKDSYARKHRYLDNQITRLEKTNHYNREQITTLKKRKLKLKDKQVSLEREAVKHAKEIQLALGIGSQIGLDIYRQIIYNYTMIHKISDLCKKIDGLKTLSTKLYEVKYNNPTTPERDAEVNHLIEDIQATCRLIANDKKPYDNG